MCSIGVRLYPVYIGTVPNKKKLILIVKMNARGYHAVNNLDRKLGQLVGHFRRNANVVFSHNGRYASYKHTYMILIPVQAREKSSNLWIPAHLLLVFFFFFFNDSV